MSREGNVGEAGAGPDRKLASDGWTTGRTESFSDAVFAIAITLLVLDLRVPTSAFDDLWAGLPHQGPSYVAHATSPSAGSRWLITGSSIACTSSAQRSWTPHRFARVSRVKPQPAGIAG